jgi:glycosyltransferase involved in cell wall biosynthesis
MAELRILVVDNDPALSGHAAFLSAQQDGGVTMRYCAEAVPGLAAARNRALTELNAMDFIAFLDDDETAEPNWLEELLRVQLQYGADVVCGPVEPRFDRPPQWIIHGNFFAARHMTTGFDPVHVGAGNVLFRASIGGAFHFDSSFSHSGGEDTHFFLCLRRAGHSFVWADHAVAYESILPERMTAGWLIRRAHSDAYRLTRSVLALDPGWQSRMLRFVAAAGNLVLGCAMLPLAALGKDRAVKALRRIARAGGTLSALMNRPHAFYGVPVDKNDQ